MKGWGFKVQVGRTHLYVRTWPFFWEVQTSLMAPREFGFGAWITKDWSHA